MPSTPFSFAFVSNSAVVAEKVQAYAQEHGWPLEEVRLATMEEALPVARRLFAQGVDVILGGGGTGKLLRRHLNEPVVTISRSHMSILQALMEAREYTDNVAVTCYDAIPPWTELFSRLLHIRLQPIRFTNSRELTLGITQAIAQGAGCVVGGGVCVSIAQAHHCPGIVVCPGNEALERAFEEASNIAQARRRDREHAAWLQDVVDALHEGVIGVDPAGKLAISNPVARQALGRERLRDGWALQHLGLAQSLETGRPTEGTLKGENGQDLVFTSSAVVVDGIQKGALSVLTPDVVLTDLQRRLKHSRQAGLRARFTLNDLLGESPSMQTLRVHAQRFAESDAVVYIHGESGTGKELLAHAIHNASPPAPRGLRGRQLRRPAGKPAGERTVRLCRGGVHRCPPRRQAGPVRTGPGRHHLPGRDSGHQRRRTGQAPACPGKRRDLPPWRRQARDRQCPCGLLLLERPCAGGQGRALPGRPLLPPDAAAPGDAPPCANASRT